MFVAHVWFYGRQSNIFCNACVIADTLIGTDDGPLGVLTVNCSKAVFKSVKPVLKSLSPIVNFIPAGSN